MLNAIIAKSVEFCIRKAPAVIAAGIIIAVASGIYATRNFAVNTDITQLISEDLPWRQRELAYEKAFPQSVESIIAVIDGPTPEFAAAASRDLVARLSGRPDVFYSVSDVAGRNVLSAQRPLVCPF
jgi:uncharacterized protein